MKRLNLRSTLKTDTEIYCKQKEILNKELRRFCNNTCELMRQNQNNAIILTTLTKYYLNGRKVANCDVEDTVAVRMINEELEEFIADPATANELNFLKRKK